MIQRKLCGIPIPIVVLFCIDAALVVAYVGLGLVLERNLLGTGALLGVVRRLVGLEDEGSLATWFSAIQLFLLAVMLALHAWRFRAAGASRVVWLPALVVLLMSLDEVVMLHEWVGGALDFLLPNGTRRNTVVHFSGLWGVVIGVPALVLLVWMWIRLRWFLSASPGALSKFIVGSVLLVVGAAGMDFLANWTFETSTWLHGIEVILEEGLEMVGVTMMCWGAWDLFAADGFRITYNPVAATKVGAIDLERQLDGSGSFHSTPAVDSGSA